MNYDFLNQLPVPFMLVFVALIFGDIAMGASLAWKEGNFRLQRVADAFMDKALPFGITLLVLTVIKAAAKYYTNAGDELLSIQLSTWADWAFNLSWGTICLTLVGSIAENVGAITGGKVEFPPIELPPLPDERPGGGEDVTEV